jgi:hypothetical protein
VPEARYSCIEVTNVKKESAIDPERDLLDYREGVD